MKKTKFENYADRYRTGKFRGLLSGGNLGFVLDKAVDNSRTVIVPSGELRVPPAKGKRFKIFLVNKTQTGGNWIGRLWPEGENPWITRNLPEVGSEVLGIVTFVQPSAAFLDINYDGKTLTGYLNPQRLPEKQSFDITKVLFIGDKICGTVMPHGNEHLNIEIDVGDWVLNLRNRARLQIEASNTSTEQQIKRSLSMARNEILKGVRIVFADDDKKLLKDVEQWLSSVGAEVRTASTSGQLEAVLKDFSPTHALLDFKMPEIKNFEDCIRLLQKSQPQVAIFSGYGDSENFNPEPYKAGYLPKPAYLNEIIGWIQNPKPAKQADVVQRTQSTEENNNWSVCRRQSDVILIAQDTLKRMCERHNLAGAAWFIEHAEGSYELRTCCSSVSRRNMEAAINQIGQSVVSSACRDKRIISRRLSHNDPLYNEACRVCGNIEPYFAALPIITENLSPRVILFFSPKIFEKGTLESIAARQDHFELLIRHLQQEEYNDRIEAFATLGLSTTATLHEIRQRAQSLAVYPDAFARRLQQGQNLDHVRNLVEDLDKHVSDLIQLSRESLKSLHKKQRAILAPVKIAKNVVKSMKEIREKVFDRRHVNILFQDNIGERVRTHISPIVLEQPLMNLVGNSLSILPNEDWAQIVVSVNYLPEDIQHPIHIDVVDNGVGMTAQQISRLFEPRGTSKDYGTGLGLFISRGLITSLGGDLKLVDSIRWGGSKFRISLPVTFGDHISA